MFKFKWLFAAAMAALLVAGCATNEVTPENTFACSTPACEKAMKLCIAKDKAAFPVKEETVEEKAARAVKGAVAFELGAFPSIWGPGPEPGRFERFAACMQKHGGMAGLVGNY